MVCGALQMIQHAESTHTSLRCDAMKAQATAVEHWEHSHVTQMWRNESTGHGSGAPTSVPVKFYI